MAVATSTCTAPCGCDRPAARSGLCWAHVRAKQRNRPLVPLKVKAPSTFARLISAALNLADTDTGDDEAYDRAQDNLRKASEAHRRGSFADAVRDGLQAARARGVKLGRPAGLEPVVARKAVKQHGSVAKAAQALGLSRFAIWRALNRGRAKR